jgi:hypothetical protein
MDKKQQVEPLQPGQNKDTGTEEQQTGERPGKPVEFTEVKNANASGQGSLERSEDRIEDVSGEKY